MSEERQRRIKEIFFEACNRPEVQRTAFVVEACGDDASLRHEVELLLAHHSEATIIPVRRTSVVDRLFDDVPPSKSHSKSSLGSVSKRFHRWAARLGLSGQLALGACFAIFVLVGLMLWLRSHIADVIERSTVAQLSSLLDGADNGLSHWIDARRYEGRVVSSRPEVRAALERMIRRPSPAPTATLPTNAPTSASSPTALDGSTTEKESPHVEKAPTVDPATVEAYLAAVKARSGDDAEIILWDPQKRLLATNAPADAAKPGPIEKLADTFAPVLSGEGVLLMPHHCQQLTGKAWFGHEKPRIGVLVPARTSAGEIAGVLFIGRAMYLAQLNEMLAKYRPQATGEAYLFNDKGYMLTESRFKDDLVRSGVLDANRESILGFKLSDPGGDLTRGYKLEKPYFANYRPRALMEAVNGLEGVVSEPYRDYRGVTVVGASRWRKLDDFGICVEIDRSEALSALHYTGIMVIVAMVLLGGTLAAIGWSSWANRRLRKRLAEQPLIGSYLLDIQIGEGGMGRVYRAQHALLKRPTAVKIIKPDLVNDQTMAWFEREVKLASRLSHPNTIEIYDYGRTDNGQFYCAMEYLRGLTLSQVILIEGFLPLPRALHILYQACSSLAEAHDLGMIHRDVKLHNLMLCLLGPIS